MAASGRLRVAERRAVELIHAAGTGAILTLLSTAPKDRALDLADAMYDAVMRAILTDAPARADGSATAATVAFRALVPAPSTLINAERVLLAESLDRDALR